MTAAVLCIGTELTRGEIVNTNATWLAGRLTELGQQVTAIDGVDDDPARIGRALQRLGAEHELVVCTGGLGPTTDDLTSQSVAALLGVPLVRDRASLAAIEARMTRAGRTMAESNRKQADFPRGAQVLPNEEGTAPGFMIQIGRARTYFLPGVPREMQAMFELGVAPTAAPAGGRRAHQIRLRTFGLPESAVNDRLHGIEAEHRVVLAYRAHFPEIEVKVLAQADSDAAAHEKARAAADDVIARLGHDLVYAEGDAGLPEVVVKLLLEHRRRLALAESCTGGLVAKLITDVAGASEVFLGGAVTYHDHAKQQWLGVPAALLERHGAVSAEVAEAMARGARQRFGADVTLALTGIAGPSGGTPDKPVGTVHYAVATAAGVESRLLSYPGTRAQIRLRSAFAGLALVREVLRAATETPSP